MKHNNKGYSLVEMIAVLAVWAVMLGGTISIAGYMNGSKAKSAAYTIQSAINKARVEAMSKSTGGNGITVAGENVKDVYLTIEQDPNDNYYAVLHSRTGETREYLGNDRLDIQGRYLDDSIPTNPQYISTSIEQGSTLYIDFKRDTGSLSTHPASFRNITEITVNQGNVTYVVSFVKVTGKVSLSRE